MLCRERPLWRSETRETRSFLLLGTPQRAFPTAKSQKVNGLRHVDSNAAKNREKKLQKTLPCLALARPSCYSIAKTPFDAGRSYRKAPRFFAPREMLLASCPSFRFFTRR